MTAPCEPRAPIDEPDVLVIGGGPAGCTAATLLAHGGRDVLLLERDRHPRFHVGESLLPRNQPILERLGVADRVHAMGVFKPGAEFVSDHCGRAVGFPFALGLDRRYTHSYQVRRDQFDAMLFANAAEQGARVADGTRVTAVELDGPDGRARVEATGPDGATRTIRPRYVLDASGRDAFLAGKLAVKDANKRNATAAVFGHFRGAEHRTGDREGYITIHLADDGWFWMIPLPDGIMSVGYVAHRSVFKARGGGVAEMFEGKIAASPTVSARMRGAELVGGVSTTGNYSYRARTGSGGNHMLIGDAYGFVDPIFSSGVLLAMTAGELGAQVAETWLDDPRAGRAAARRAERRMRREMDAISWLIYRIHTPVLRAMFMTPVNRFRMRDGLVSMLAGNLRGDLRSRLPVLAFKTAFYGLSAARRLGLEPQMMRAQPAG